MHIATCILAAQHRHFLDTANVLFQQSHTIAPITVDESSVLHERTERANQLATLADHCVLRSTNYFGGRKIAPCSCMHGRSTSASVHGFRVLLITNAC
jgi:hypothetical protein